MKKVKGLIALIGIYWEKISQILELFEIQEILPISSKAFVKYANNNLHAIMGEWVIFDNWF